MPHRVAADHDDPIVASYPVYLTALKAPIRPLSPSTSSASSNPAATGTTTTTKKRNGDGKKLVVLQYPAHRPASTPYNARHSQAPTSLRLKPSTGLLEVDIPIDTQLNYNSEKGSTYATSLKQSCLVQEGGTHGLSGGFSTGPVGQAFREGGAPDETDLKDIPVHPSSSGDGSISESKTSAENGLLNVQTLCGKIVEPAAGDPIYMLGRFEDNAIHLSQLDAVIQLRPELHHLDAADEVEKIRVGRGAAVRFKSAKEVGTASSFNPDISSSSTLVPPPPPRPSPSTKAEGKAIDIKLKPSGTTSHGTGTDPTTNSNVRLVRAIQQEKWQTYQWIDEDDPESRRVAKAALVHRQNHLQGDLQPPEIAGTPWTTEPSPKKSQLQSAISNSQWLDLMSVPRIEHVKRGDKGLLGKVRGRERERQRRKRNEAARKSGRENVLGDSSYPPPPPPHPRPATAAAAAAAAAAGSDGVGAEATSSATTIAPPPPTTATTTITTKKDSRPGKSKARKPNAKSDMMEGMKDATNDDDDDDDDDDAMMQDLQEVNSDTNTNTTTTTMTISTDTGTASSSSEADQDDQDQDQDQADDGNAL